VADRELLEHERVPQRDERRHQLARQPGRREPRRAPAGERERQQGEQLRDDGVRQHERQRRRRAVQRDGARQPVAEPERVLAEDRPRHGDEVVPQRVPGRSSGPEDDDGRRDGDHRRQPPPPLLRSPG
jgi:hypothetical protein